MRLVHLFALCAASLLTVPAHAQSVLDAIYPFDGTLNDEGAAYTPIGGDGATYFDRAEGQALALTGATHFDLPMALSQAIQTDKSFRIAFDFMAPSTMGEDDLRFVIGNKDDGYPTPGFHVMVWPTGEEGYVNFRLNIGGALFYEQAVTFRVEADTWHTGGLTLDFEAETLTFSWGGIDDTRPLREAIDGVPFNPEPLIESLTTRPIRIGAAFRGDDYRIGAEPYWGENNTAETTGEVYLDNLRISSPRPAGDVSAAAAILDQLSDDLEGRTELTPEAAEALTNQLRLNLTGATLDQVGPAVRRFIDAHNAVHEPFFIADEQFRTYADLNPASRAYVELGAWLVRDGLTAANVGLAEGLIFPEHEFFPGAVPAEAERVQNGSVEVNATYLRYPWYNLGGMLVDPNNELAASVYRPTGFYAPAGELVRITVDPLLVNSGLHIRVGAHTMDHMVFTESDRMPVLSIDYRIESETMEVVNPLGGGIYVMVPLTVDLGWTSIGIDGAVRAPYFSYRAGRETSQAEWAQLRNAPGPFADFESDKYKFTVPSSLIRSFEDPAALMAEWDRVQDVFQKIFGRPLERDRAEAFLLDTRSTSGASYPTGYPMTPGRWAWSPPGRASGRYTPFALTDGMWLQRHSEFSILLHEKGHWHVPHVMPMEQEVVVNVPAAAVAMELYGIDYDTATRISGFQDFTRTQAAIDWMVQENFRNGRPIGTEVLEGGEEIISVMEQRYQTRGHAKYVDLAEIGGGWEAMGRLYRQFYEDARASGIPTTTAGHPNIERDEYLLTGSRGLGCNLASLFHFWGIHPSPEAATQLAAFPACEGADARILTYLHAAPRTRGEVADFFAFADRYINDPNHEEDWRRFSQEFTPADGQQIRTEGLKILRQYFNTQPDAAPTTPVLQTGTFNTSGEGAVTFSWTASEDEQPLTYAWQLTDQATGELLVWRSEVEGTRIEVPAAELAAALAPRLAQADSVVVKQEVVTADAFAVVVSDPLYTVFTGTGEGAPIEIEENEGGETGTSTEEGTLPYTTQLEAAYPNPFNPVTTIRYELAETSPVRIQVVDVLGRQVAVLANEARQAPGLYQVRFDGSGLASGTYFVRMQAGSFVQTQTVLLAK
ncbi:MAG: M60 family metallopeptidase [Bacteroidota bacterium]